MSKYVALVSFSGAISMYKGEERELKSKELISDLLRAQYIEEIKVINEKPVIEVIKEEKTTNEEINEVVESEDK
ncbi:hypothetical protein [Fusobacterium varium]